MVSGSATIVTADVAREGAENFPVALRLLPRSRRDALHAAYALARRIDDVGDDPRRTPEQRHGDLDELAADLEALWSGGTPADPHVASVAATARRLPRAPFLDLLEANRQDQSLTRLATYDDLLGYCALSANPIGRVVLAIFEVDDLQAKARSDDVCTALQILEHCQDIAEDLRDRDRVYLPQTDLDRSAVTEADLCASTASAAVRRLVTFEVDRAAGLLGSGNPLVRSLSGWGRVAVAGYVAGGLATVDALRRIDGDVLAADAQSRQPRRTDVVRHLARLVVAP